MENEHTEKEQGVITKKQAALEVMGHMQEKKEILIANMLGAVAIVGASVVSYTAALIITGSLIVYDAMKYIKNRSYSEYLKSEYDL